ncbi:Golgi pH regulator B [Cyphellophora attinorum]|uniref:Golgi pH regulator B n=1 Tax=Cyphellophora attinorum TaxID=1664694 RepID=A0A0N1HDG2_9EURO|nr:Golgi pH regulator B [Phialophora attinorum]KPI42433.1 Golgi pH regulator B [Phialophora attinorum]
MTSLISSDDCDDCSPMHSHFGPKAAFSTVPFITTFGLVTFIAYRKVHPLLSPAAPTSSTQQSSKGLPPTLPTPSTYSEPPTQFLIRRFAALTFASTIALSAVLTELLLCEISNSFNPTARSVALQVTVASLLGLLVIAIPVLGIHTVVTSNGQRIKDASNRKKRVAWVVEAVGYAAFLCLFWALGALLPDAATPSDEVKRKGLNLFQACLDRLGITGVTLMALLSGFASVSAIWQNFGPKAKLVADGDIKRKETGYDATMEMVDEKKARLNMIQRRMTDPASATSTNASFWSRAAGSILPLGKNTDSQEKQTLEMEISGLETMAASLESSLSVLRGRKADQMREKTTFGRAQLAFGVAFSCYCIYRIIATTINIFRRVAFGTHSNKSDTDPVTYGIALFARHVYPSIDQASWAHQISFLLSGVMLFASFNAVTQTFYLFARIMPHGVLQATRTNFALLISQISGMYVISSALMLRGMMPEKVGSVINSALGAGLLEPAWTQRWFEGWYMAAVVVTVLGIGITRSWKWDVDEGGGWEREASR